MNYGGIRLSNLEFIWNLENVNMIIKIIEICVIELFTYYTFAKIINTLNINLKNIIITLLSIPIFSIFMRFVQYKIDMYLSLSILIFLMCLMNKLTFKKNMLYSLSLTVISLSINYTIYVISTIIAFIPSTILKISNDYISFIIITSIYFFIIYRLFKIQKFKYGISFLQKNLEELYFNLLILNIGAITLFSLIILQSYSGLDNARIGTGFLILCTVMFITIKKSFNLYYKQNLITKELEQTKMELEDSKKELKQANKDNIEISERIHTLDHKQKLLKYNLDKLMENRDIDENQKKRMKEELDNISKDLYGEPKEIELTKTDIESIDNRLEYMKFQCIENNIKFELQVEGNIHYMINNLISENDLDILLADHIKDAIIAINYSKNSNRSILVKMGKLDEFYGVYIYDSGIEFEKEVLEKLGKEPITTHKDSGGSGMGFMNTFKKLNKTKASLVINEIGEPSVDNYTKAVMFKFDNKQEFRVETYKEICEICKK